MHDFLTAIWDDMEIFDLLISNVTDCIPVVVRALYSGARSRARSCVSITYLRVLLQLNLEGGKKRRYSRQTSPYILLLTLGIIVRLHEGKVLEEPQPGMSS